MTDTPTNPTDTIICGLLAAGPLPTAALAARLGIPERTARHRLYRLRQAGTVVSGTDGLHHLATTTAAARIAGGLPPRDTTVPTAATAAPVPPRDTTAGDLAAPVMAAHQPDHDGSSSRQGGRWGTGAIRAAAVFGLAAAAGIAIAVAIHWKASPAPPPLSPAPPPLMGFGYPGDPWGGMRW